MRSGARIRTGVALAVALTAAAGARAQVPTVRIDDVRVVEGSSGPWDQPLTVTLSSSSTSTVSVGWSTVDGSAISGTDYTYKTGTVTFPPGTTAQTLTVTIAGDTVVEWSPTLQMDRAFFVQLGTPTNATLLKGRATVTIVDDDRPLPGLQLVSAVADGSPGSGRVRLQWRVPPSTASGAPTDVLVRWNEGPTCTAPATATSMPVTGEFLISGPPLPTQPATVSPAGSTQIFAHLGQSFVKHCYALFAVYSPGGNTMEGAVVSATPFDATAPNPVAWTYSIGGSSPGLVPPTVGSNAVYTISNDGVVHAMTRGPGGGAWPPGWNPVSLGKAASNRSPVVPLSYGQRLLVGTQIGEVHAVDGDDGSIAWSRSVAFKNTQLSNAPGAQCTPAGLFTNFGGTNDVILVGTGATTGSTFYMLNPLTGDNINTFTHGLLGAVLGMPVVDYVGNRVYSVTTLPTGVLWAFDLGPPLSPGLGPSALPGGNPLSLAFGTNGSPVLSNSRIYFGATNGDVIAYRPASGQARALGTGDGEVKGFVFPDRRNNSFYFSTTNKVWGITDTGSPDPILSLKWLPVTDILTPTTVLHWTGTKYLYVGGGDGRLYQIDVDSGSLVTVPAKTSMMLEAGKQIGPPSLDGPNGLVIVGSETGVIYAVRVPLP